MLQLSELLNRPSTAATQAISEQMRSLFPDKQISELANQFSELESFADAGHSELRPLSPSDDFRHEQYDSDSKSVVGSAQNGKYRLKHGTNEFEFWVFKLPGRYDDTSHLLAVYESAETLTDLLSALHAFTHVVGQNVLVFDGGCFQRSKNMFEALKGATFENLVLQGDLSKRIQSDSQAFFASRDTYRTYGLPWKRGVILIGEPGNGKTHTVKALINLLGVSTLYVKSLESSYGTEHSNIQKVFAAARRFAPCLVIFEDLDSMIHDKNRSFFLNELDGFDRNDGLFILATTNHPDRLDPALVERPSRFDRKYLFELPDEKTRQVYLLRFSNTLNAEFHLTSEEADKVSALTEGFSFAYLKELFLSSLMGWINLGSDREFSAVMLENVSVLRQQMNSKWSSPGSSELGKEDDDGEEVE